MSYIDFYIVKYTQTEEEERRQRTATVGKDVGIIFKNASFGEATLLCL